jgi:sortase A
MPKKLLLTILFVVLFFTFFAANPNKTKDKKPTAIIEVPVVLAETFANPSLLNIPKLALNAKIISVGLDNNNLMSIPEDNNSVGWWKFGALPGQMGNSVLGGHSRIVDGSPGVFYNLNKLIINDDINVVDENNKTVNFKVNEIKIFDTDKFPTSEIYGSSNDKNLILITCAGEYINGDYNKRLVIYAQVI